MMPTDTEEPTRTSTGAQEINKSVADHMLVLIKEGQQINFIKDEPLWQITFSSTGQHTWRRVIILEFKRDGSVLRFDQTKHELEIFIPAVRELDPLWLFTKQVLQEEISLPRASEFSIGFPFGAIKVIGLSKDTLSLIWENGETLKVSVGEFL